MAFSSFINMSMILFRTIELGKNRKDIMAKIDYVRISSSDQNLARQLEQLKDADKIFQEAISGAEKNRPELQRMLNYIREGDIVIITELERLGRNNRQLTEVMNYIQEKGATLEVLNLPTLRGIEDDNLRRLLNNLILESYKYQAQAERDRIKERQTQGIALARKNGRYTGRKSFAVINERTFRRYRNKYNITR